MAGSIIVSPSESVALNSIGFDLVTSALRAELVKDAPEILDAIFESMDLGFMPFISFSSLSPEDFLKLYHCARAAKRNWEEIYPDYFPEAEELMIKLKADSRMA